jgi:Uma2 family endonuclease
MAGTGTLLEDPMSGVTEIDPGLELYERMDPVEGFSTEYIHGAIVMMAAPNTFHNRIMNLIDKQIPDQDFMVWNDTAVAITGHSDRPMPDLTVTDIDLADTFFKAIPSELVLLAVEIVSTTRASKRNDHVDKTELYSQGGIPLYLLVDPNDGTWRLHTEPNSEKELYEGVQKGDFGEPITLPEPFGLTITTDRFLRYP